MSPNTFGELLQLAGTFDDDFQHRRAGYAYRLGMPLQVDEVFSTRFEEMSFVEFQHAVGAAVFLRSSPLGNSQPARLAAALRDFFARNLRMALRLVGSPRSGARRKS